MANGAGQKIGRALSLGAAAFGQGVTGQPFATNLLATFEKRREVTAGVKTTDKIIDELQKLPGQEGKFEEFRGIQPDELTKVISNLDRVQPSPSEEISKKKLDIIQRGQKDPKSLSAFERELVGTGPKEFKLSASDIGAISSLESLEQPPTFIDRLFAAGQLILPGEQPEEAKIRGFEAAKKKFPGLTKESAAVLKTKFKSQFKTPDEVSAGEKKKPAAGRQKAIDFLKKNKALITEANIEAVIKKFKFD